MLGESVAPSQLLQARSPSLDLDSLYGAGPGDPGSAKFYKPDGIRLKTGTTEAIGHGPEVLADAVALLSVGEAVGGAAHGERSQRLPIVGKHGGRPAGDAGARVARVRGIVASRNGSVGLLAGGVITQGINWHWIFFINVPIGVAVALLARRLVAAQPGGPASAPAAQSPQRSTQQSPPRPDARG